MNLGDLFELRILPSMWSEFQRIFTLPWFCSLWVFKPPCRFRKVQDVQEDANKTFFKDMLVWICWRCVSVSCWVHSIEIGSNIPCCSCSSFLSLSSVIILVTMYEFQLGQRTNILQRESQIKSNWLIVQKVSEGVASIYSLHCQWTA